MKTLRERFFEECTDKGADGLQHVNIAPHDLFEWFKKEYSGAVRIKPLVWNGDGEIFASVCNISIYEVFTVDGYGWIASCDGKWIKRNGESIEEAKSACESHYRQKMMEGCELINNENP
jgi:hypothetical protein